MMVLRRWGEAEGPDRGSMGLRRCFLVRACMLLVVECKEDMLAGEDVL